MGVRVKVNAGVPRDVASIGGGILRLGLGLELRLAHRACDTHSDKYEDTRRFGSTDAFVF